ncbi:MAG: hypothetical protein NUV55_13320 [Sulfuricaulis sp.]|uniref:hypothetical protein n=1 Tax=Sulfuricaulis sp. TaxID=2003553 RepID=UPI0025D4FFB6|nr:hypothetical protein [Sulfuricaulis sp.]MCR4348162.1 hypothetical protein [Sulfuricaulis sp.]
MDKITDDKIKEPKQLSIDSPPQDIVSQDSPSKASVVEPEHPLAKNISLYLHRLRDIQVSLQAFMRLQLN